ncbi:olfactory receptor 14A16-like [Notechis scutatus]|uniref:Olfactory receptor 14A16-like n=1 Tax=Notechis scutatus TaxID=8663 RepID=A0A6J1VN93_9SAUR|nr:olfactory receptor 14A16-like [Notechis scutatus]
MAYDWYIAICNSLQYEMIRKASTKMIGGIWIASFLNASLHTIFTFITSLCSNIIHQFYCEFPYLLKIACPGIYASEIGAIIFSTMLTLSCFIFVLVIYVHVCSAVLRIPLVQGRKKAFSICLPHLIVFSLFVFTVFFAYLRDISDNSSYLGYIITMLYSIIPPMTNLLIYSMRNKDIKLAISRLLSQRLFYFTEVGTVYLSMFAFDQEEKNIHAIYS